MDISTPLLRRLRVRCVATGIYVSLSKYPCLHVLDLWSKDGDITTFEEPLTRNEKLAKLVIPRNMLLPSLVDPISTSIYTLPPLLKAVRIAFVDTKDKDMVDELLVKRPNITVEEESVCRGWDELKQLWGDRFVPYDNSSLLDDGFR